MLRLMARANRHPRACHGAIRGTSDFRQVLRRILAVVCTLYDDKLDGTITKALYEENRARSRRSLKTSREAHGREGRRRAPSSPPGSTLRASPATTAGFSSRCDSFRVRAITSTGPFVM
jgi:hypothetical protein